MFHRESSVTVSGGLAPCGHWQSPSRISISRERLIGQFRIQLRRPITPPDTMLIVHVHVRVNPEHVDAFKAATLANAHASVREPGIAAFEVVQQLDDATRFVLVEVYRTAAAPAAHKETAHYALWRDTVAPMMAEPRTSVKFSNVFPDDAGW